jgi:hypothetical protein
MKGKTLAVSGFLEDKFNLRSPDGSVTAVASETVSIFCKSVTRNSLIKNDQRQLPNVDPATMMSDVVKV